MQDQLALRPEVSSVAAARAFVREALTRWNGTHDTFTAVQLTSELVTNAVVHARTAIILTVRYDPPLMTVEVQDGSDQLPRHGAVGLSES